jgi:hypothetical protein
MEKEEKEQEIEEGFLIPEVVEETPNLPQVSVQGKIGKIGKIGKKKGDTRGKLSIKYRKIAEMASRGWSVSLIAKEVGLTENRVYVILKENDQVWEYINQIIKDTFSEGDRILAALYKKAMIGIDEDLSSGDADVRIKTREQILKLWSSLSKAGEEGSGPQFNLIQQFFSGGKGTGIVQSMDEIILQKRKERGLLTQEEPKQEDEEDEGITE